MKVGSVRRFRECLSYGGYLNDDGREYTHLKKYIHAMNQIWAQYS